MASIADIATDLSDIDQALVDLAARLPGAPVAVQADLDNIHAHLGGIKSTIAGLQPVTPP